MQISFIPFYEVYIHFLHMQIILTIIQVKLLSIALSIAPGQLRVNQQTAGIVLLKPSMEVTVKKQSFGSST